jgi:DNA-binding NarL/FixJ family response regulator
MGRATILVVDDHPLFREALQMAVATAAPEAAIHEAGTLAQALETVRSDTAFDLILLDLMMPDSNGLTGLAALHAERPHVPIIVVSAADPAAFAHRARAYGAIGFLSKAAQLDVIAQAVRLGLEGAARVGDDATSLAAAEGLEPRTVANLTPTQLKVLMGLLEGRLNKQIAYDLGISEATVKAHMTVVFRKLNVRNRTQAVLSARGLGLEAMQPA